MSGADVTIQMSERTAMQFRYILPLLVEALGPLHDDADKQELVGALEQAVEDIDRALPERLRVRVDERHIAERRMDVIDKQRTAGVRPPATSSLQDSEGSG